MLFIIWCFLWSSPRSPVLVFLFLSLIWQLKCGSSVLEIRIIVNKVQLDTDIFLGDLVQTIITSSNPYWRRHCRNWRLGKLLDLPCGGTGLIIFECKTSTRQIELERLHID